VSSGFTVLIPARLASTRLPGKPLREIAGQPMILHVAARARESGARAVWVATDDETVREACGAAGVSVLMTRDDHESGSERLAEACDLLSLEDDDIVVNVQGDEPLIPPGIITQVAELLDDCDEAGMASLYHRMENDADVRDPNAVKVVCDAQNRALYFSRAPVPWDRDGETLARDPGSWRRHIGLYAYRAGFLRQYVDWPPAPAERLEALEQLRALHHGETIIMAEASELPGPGIDTPADLERVRSMFASMRDEV
jgi:3-deoxy-manno-octulosonate cytidylyltransferase (CMP-KDO synthetase)